MPKINTINSDIDVLLLCALKDEYDQVLEVTENMKTEGWTEGHDPSGRTVAEAIFTTEDGREFSVRATWMAHMGREQAQAVTSVIIKDTPARCIAMSGICAGRRGKVNLGDVIFADRLWSYDAGKSVFEDGNEKFEGDMLQYNPKEVWVQQMQRVKFRPETKWIANRPRLPYEFQEDWVLQCLAANESPIDHTDFTKNCPDWTEVLQRLWRKKWVDKPLELTAEGREYVDEKTLLYPEGLPKPGEFLIHPAPMATGAKVVEDKDIFSRLSKSMRKVLGVDMEASGLAALAEAHGIPIIVAKGVSDFGDTFKDDRYRCFAARASAEAVISFLRNSSHLYLHEVREYTDMLSNSAEQTLPRNTAFSRELINTLAELYPNVEDVRALWERSGGRYGDIENISRPRDLWQGVWKKTSQGATVSPMALLAEVLVDFPDNAIINDHLKRINNAAK